MKPIRNKIVVIGAGMVGSSVVDSLLPLGLAAEIVIIDQNKDKAKGQALDASHTTAFTYSPNVLIRSGDYEDCSDAQIIIMTAGPSIKPGEKLDRLVLADKNVKVMNSVMASITKYTKDAVIIVVTNPVDIVAYLAQNHFDYPKEKIIGSGTLLDTARLRRIIAKKYLVDTKNVHGYVLGEHGNSAFAAWSLINISGIPADEFDKLLGSDSPLDKEAIIKETREVGIDVLKLKGYTSSGIAMSVCRIVKAVLLNELSVLPVSTTLTGEYGIDNVALSLPCIVGSNGIQKRLQVPLNKDEVVNLKSSADNLIKILEDLKVRK
ncbi:MAG: L-lactate dehydrogenase [Clostridium sp.]|nr:L-lactate dehydrogenase [Clostridium sp.]